MRSADDGRQTIDHEKKKLAKCSRKRLAVEGGFDGEAAALEDVGVDHGGFYVFVSEEFLHSADVVAVL